jgi:uncharacterized YccA/Bax inhibitor family protein
MQSHNPVLSRRDAFDRVPTPTPQQLQELYQAPGRMTLDDVTVKTGGLLALIMVTGGLAWALNVGFGVAIAAALAAFVVALVVIFKRAVNPGLIVTYAALEGVFLGAVSHAYNDAYNGIVVQAVAGTALCFAGVLVAYRSGKLRVTPRFTKMIIGAMIGIIGLMLLNLLVSLFGGSLGIRDGGGLAIVFSLVVIAVASLSFALDFDAIERAIAQGAPERQSWLAAFGLVVGLVWLYLEILRFISYFRE